MKKVFLYSLIFSAIVYAQNFSPTLPDSVEGWNAPDSPVVYIGEDLYRLINGGADIFHEYGFKKVLTQKYINSNEKIISVEIYEMNDSSAAFGIFSLFTFNTGKPVKFNSDAYAGDEFFLFQKGNYYVSLTGNESSLEIQTGLISIAEKIGKIITPSGKPVLVNKFIPLKYSRAAYIKGNLGLYNLRSIDFGKGLRVKEGICIKDENSISIILMYKSEKECSTNLLLLINNSKNKQNYELIEKEDPSYIFKDQEGKYFLITRVMDFIIISISADKLKASDSAKKIKEIIN